MDTSRGHQPKALLFRVLTLLWVFPSLGAIVVMVASGWPWGRGDGLIAGMGAVAFEQWIAAAVLLAHALFAWLAWHYRRAEPFKDAPPERPADEAPGRNVNQLAD